MSETRIVGLKVDECPACERTCAHWLERDGRRGKRASLRCGSCGHVEPIPETDARRAVTTGHLAVSRTRTGFESATAPSEIQVASTAPVLDPFAEPDAWVEEAVAAARTNLARGWTRPAAEAELYDTVMVKGGLAREGGNRSWVVVAGVAIALGVLVATAGGILALGGGGAEPQVTAAAATADPTPAAVSVVEASRQPVLDATASPTEIPNLTPPPSTPTLTIAPSPAVVVPTSPPTAAPTSFVRPSAQPGERTAYSTTDLAALESVLPTDLVADCAPVERYVGRGSSAAFRCQPTEHPGSRIDYVNFKRQAQANRVFDEVVGRLDRSGRPCSRGARSVEGTAYWRPGAELDEAILGERACALVNDRAVLLWTNRESHTLMRAEFDRDDLEAYAHMFATTAIWPCDTERCE